MQGRTVAHWEVSNRVADLVKIIAVCLASRVITVVVAGLIVALVEVILGVVVVVFGLLVVGIAVAVAVVVVRIKMIPVRWITLTETTQLLR